MYAIRSYYADTTRLTVFGDSVNDIGMFRLAGTSVAVANALEEVKAHADISYNFV